MSLAVFKEKILTQASTDAERLLHDNTNRVKEVRDNATHDIRMLEEDVIAVATKEAHRQARSIHQYAELEGRSLVLEAKQRELQKTKDALLLELASLSEQQKQELYTVLLALVPKAHGEVIPQSDGGLIYRGESIEINLSLSQLVEQLFRMYRSEIAKELFS